MPTAIQIKERKNMSKNPISIVKELEDQNIILIESIKFERTIGGFICEYYIHCQGEPHNAFSVVGDEKPNKKEAKTSTAAKVIKILGNEYLAILEEILKSAKVPLSVGDIRQLFPFDISKKQVNQMLYSNTPLFVQMQQTPPRWIHVSRAKTSFNVSQNRTPQQKEPETKSSSQSLILLVDTKTFKKKEILRQRPDTKIILFFQQKPPKMANLQNCETRFPDSDTISREGLKMLMFAETEPKSSNKNAVYYILSKDESFLEVQKTAQAMKRNVFLSFSCPTEF